MLSVKAVQKFPHTFHTATFIESWETERERERGKRREWGEFKRVNDLYEKNREIQGKKETER